MRHELSPEYLTYIHSKEWRSLADKIRARDIFCQGCNGTSKLDVHHKTYRNFTREDDEDLVLLCRICHEAVHQLAKTFPLDVATEMFIDMMVSRRSKGQKVIFLPKSKRLFKSKKGKRAKKYAQRMKEGSNMQRAEREINLRRHELRSLIRNKIA